MNGKVALDWTGDRHRLPTPPRPRRLLRIQEVAADTGLTPRTIRYYEELGLLAPAARSEGAYRLYDADDLERLRFIRGLRDDAGFSLAEIGQLLEDEAGPGPQPRAASARPTDPAERRAILIDDASTGSTARSRRCARKIERLEAMVARGRGPPRAHLDGHLADIDAGREPSHAPRGPPAARR